MANVTPMSYTNVVSFLSFLYRYMKGKRHEKSLRIKVHNYHWWIREKMVRECNLMTKKVPGLNQLQLNQGRDYIKDNLCPCNFEPDKKKCFKMEPFMKNSKGCEIRCRLKWFLMWEMTKKLFAYSNPMQCPQRWEYPGRDRLPWCFLSQLAHVLSLKAPPLSSYTSQTDGPL